MKENNPNETIRKLARSTSLLFSSEDTLKLFDSLNTLAFARGNGCKEDEELNKAFKRETEEIAEIKKETEILASEIRKCDDGYSVLVKEKEALEVRIREISDEKIPSKEDEEILNKHKALLQLYKNITGIRWDYSAPENIVKGYICGLSKNYVHAFEFPADGDLPNKIWQEVEKASLYTSSDLNAKENIRKDNKRVTKNT